MIEDQVFSLAATPPHCSLYWSPDPLKVIQHGFLLSQGFFFCFSGLDGDCKVEEIRKLQPLVSWIKEDVEMVKRDVISLTAALQEEREAPDIDTARSGKEEVSFISTSSKHSLLSTVHCPLYSLYFSLCEE